MSLQIKPGSLLIANPFLPDPNFQRSVVCIADHSPKGTVGYVVNDKTNLLLEEVISADSNELLNINLYKGGPVEEDTLHVVHQLGVLVEGSRRLKEHIYWGGDFDKLKFLIANRNVDQRDIRFFIGYSGWGSGQLEEELEEKTWIVLNSYNSELIFSKDTDTIWENAIAAKGGKYQLLKNSPLSPDWN